MSGLLIFDESISKLNLKNKSLNINDNLKFVQKVKRQKNTIVIILIMLTTKRIAFVFTLVESFLQIVKKKLHRFVTSKCD